MDRKSMPSAPGETASFAQQKEGLGLAAGPIPKEVKQHWALAD